MSETYEKRMMRLSRIQYLYNDSDFARTSVEEFETWKGQLGLNESDQTKWRTRRVFTEKYFQSIVDQYNHDKISHEAMLQLFFKSATKNDYSLLGRFVMEAFSSKPLPNNRFLVAPYLKSYANFLKWLKKQWGSSLKGTPLQNEIRIELEELTGQKISGATLEQLLKPNASNSK